VGPDGATAAEFHLLHLGGDDHTIMVAAEVRHVTDLLQRVLTEDKGARLHSLESGKDDQGVFAVIGGGGGLRVDADIPELFYDPPVLGGDNINIGLHGFGAQNGEEAFGSIDGEVDVEGGGIFAHPLLVLYEGDALPVPRVVGGGVEHGHIVGAKIVHHHQMVAGGVEPGLMDGIPHRGERDLPGIGVTGDFFDGPIVGQAVVGEEVADGLHRGAVDDETAAAHAQTGDGVSVAGVVQAKIKTGQGVGAVPRGLASFDKKLRHGRHLIVDLIPLGAEVVVLTVLAGLEAGKADRAALGPGVGEGFGVGRPVGPEGGKHAGFLLSAGPGEKGGNVLLPVGAGETVPIGKGDRMNTQANPRGLGDVFEKFHLAGLSVVANTINVVAHAVFPKHAVFLDACLETVHEDVISTLGGIDEFETLVRVATVGIESGEVVGDGAGIPVVPVGDPRKGLLGAKIDGMRATAEFLWREVDVFSELLADALINGILHLNAILRLGGPGCSGEVAGQSGAGQTSEPGKTVVKKTSAGDFLEMTLVHKAKVPKGF